METEPHIMHIARFFGMWRNAPLEILISWESFPPSCFAHAVLSLRRTTVEGNVETGEKGEMGEALVQEFEMAVCINFVLCMPSS